MRYLGASRQLVPPVERGVWLTNSMATEAIKVSKNYHLMNKALRDLLRATVLLHL